MQALLQTVEQMSGPGPGGDGSGSMGGSSMGSTTASVPSSPVSMSQVSFMLKQQHPHLFMKDDINDVVEAAMNDGLLSLKGSADGQQTVELTHSGARLAQAFKQQERSMKQQQQQQQQQRHQKQQDEDDHLDVTNARSSSMPMYWTIPSMNDFNGLDPGGSSIQPTAPTSHDTTTRHMASHYDAFNYLRGSDARSAGGSSNDHNGGLINGFSGLSIGEAGNQTQSQSHSSPFDHQSRSHQHGASAFSPATQSTTASSMAFASSYLAHGTSSAGSGAGAGSGLHGNNKVSSNTRASMSMSMGSSSSNLQLTPVTDAEDSDLLSAYREKELDMEREQQINTRLTQQQQQQQQTPLNQYTSLQLHHNTTQQLNQGVINSNNNTNPSYNDLLQLHASALNYIKQQSNNANQVQQQQQHLGLPSTALQTYSPSHAGLSGGSSTIPLGNGVLLNGVAGGSGSGGGGLSLNLPSVTLSMSIPPPLEPAALQLLPPFPTALEEKHFRGEKLKHLKYMFHFRVHPCINFLQKGTCPYDNKNECFDYHSLKTRRRIPRIYLFSNGIFWSYNACRCQAMEKDMKCEKGEACRYAHCFEETTQILTEEGFKFRHELQAMEKSGAGMPRIATYNRHTQQLEYQQAKVQSSGSRVLMRGAEEGPFTMIDFAQPKDRVKWSNADTSTGLAASHHHHHHDVALLVTDQHTMWASRGMNAAYETMPAEALLSNPSFQMETTIAGGVAVSGEHAEAWRRLDISTHLRLKNESEVDACMELYGYWLGVGSMEQRHGRPHVCFPFHKSVAQHHDPCQRLNELFAQCDLTAADYSVSSNDEDTSGGGGVIYVTNRLWCSFFHHQPADINSAHALKWWPTRQCSMRHARLIIAGLNMANGDEGSKDGSVSVINTSSLCLRDHLMQLMLHAGYSAIFRMREKKDEDEDRDGSDCHTVASADKVWRIEYVESGGMGSRSPLAHPSFHTNHDVVKRLHHGSVWCVTVPNGLILARRAAVDGRGAVVMASRAVIVGNCKEEIAYHPSRFKSQACSYPLRADGSCSRFGKHCAFSHSHVDDDQRKPIVLKQGMPHKLVEPSPTIMQEQQKAVAKLTGLTVAELNNFNMSGYNNSMAAGGGHGGGHGHGSGNGPHASNGASLWEQQLQQRNQLLPQNQQQQQQQQTLAQTNVNQLSIPSNFATTDSTPLFNTSLGDQASHHASVHLQPRNLLRSGSAGSSTSSSQNESSSASSKQLSPALSSHHITHANANANASTPPTGPSSTKSDASYGTLPGTPSLAPLSGANDSGDGSDLSRLDPYQYMCPADEMMNDREFYVFSYKCHPCRSQTVACAKGECPNYHYDHKRRRLPRLYRYAPDPCPAVKHASDGSSGNPTAGSGWRRPSACRIGDACPFSHTQLESMYHPLSYKRQMCPLFDENDRSSWQRCPFKRACSMAHGRRELDFAEMCVRQEMRNEMDKAKPHHQPHSISTDTLTSAASTTDGASSGWNASISNPNSAVSSTRSLNDGVSSPYQSIATTDVSMPPSSSTSPNGPIKSRLMQRATMDMQMGGRDGGRGMDAMAMTMRGSAKGNVNGKSGASQPDPFATTINNLNLLSHQTLHASMSGATVGVDDENDASMRTALLRQETASKAMHMQHSQQQTSPHANAPSPNQHSHSLSNVHASNGTSVALSSSASTPTSASSPSMSLPHSHSLSNVLESLRVENHDLQDRCTRAEKDVYLLQIKLLEKENAIKHLQWSLNSEREEKIKAQQLLETFKHNVAHKLMQRQQHESERDGSEYDPNEDIRSDLAMTSTSPVASDSNLNTHEHDTHLHKGDSTAKLMAESVLVSPNDDEEDDQTD